MWSEVDGGASSDVKKFRDELLWQEYARHVYARLGSALCEPLRGEPVTGVSASSLRHAEDTATTERDDPWDTSMQCMKKVTEELHADGWMVNQTRMWFASQWSVRHGADWLEGEQAMFTHLLDGSRAANRLGWQWTIGTGNGKRYGFSRWQVEKRAATWCKQCDLSDDCPIQDWPEAHQKAPGIDPDPRIKRDLDAEATGGPSQPALDGEPEAVWLTAESLGDDDPALAAHPDLPAVFCFDEPLLRRLALSGKRLIFLTQCLADLAQRREVRLFLGDPTEQLAGIRLAATHAPVPGWRRRADALEVDAVHPWPWLHRPHGGSVQSFSAWRKQLSRR